MISNCVKIVTLLFLISSCAGNSANSSQNYNDINSESSNDYALYFNINDSLQNYKVITVNETWSGKNTQNRYILVKEGSNVNSSYSNSTIIKTPVKRVVCMSTSHLPFISALNQSASIVAVSGGQYISDSLIKAKLKNNEIQDIGFEAAINYEMLIRLNPDIVFAYGVSGENNQYIDKIKQAGISVVVISDYMENHPLGKLEYFKFFGAFFNQELMADSLYSVAKNRYLDAKSRVDKTSYKPKVLLNAPWKDAWYIPGENNYMSHLIKDAGGIVLLSKSGESHSYTNSIENVIQEAYNADFWLNPNFFTSLKELKNSNPLFSSLPILEKGTVYNNNKRDTQGGGSDFWEHGVIEPDVILNDLINILHPQLDNKKELVYYKLLK